MPSISLGVQLRRPFLFGAVFSVAFFGSFQASAQSEADALPADQLALVDRMAADFYESDLRLSQSRQIEASTASIYREMPSEDKASFRDERRDDWRAMSDEQRNALRGVKTPNYDNLADSQKAPFREIAREQLAPSEPVDDAPESGNDI